MLWLNFLHFYQPANSEIQKATQDSYERIIRAIEEHENVKFTANIAGCLLARLDEDLGRMDLIRRIKRLVLKGKLELVGSAAYHPLLPLTDARIVVAQIKENEKILKKYFGENIKLRGFFLPEMSYSPDVANLIQKLGYEWTILDEISLSGKLGQVDFSKVYLDKTSKLKIVIRQRQISQKYAPDFLIKFNKDERAKDKIVITATDAELYGLHHKDHVANFEKVLKIPRIKTATISEFIDNYGEDLKKIKPIKSSWEATERELEDGLPYFLWDHPKNALQKKLWDLARLAQKTYLKNQEDKNAWWSWWHLARGLSSCTFWWASDKDMSHVFGPRAWNPDMIELGANELIRSIRDLEQATTLQEKLKAEKKYLKIIQMVWEEHWKRRDELINNNK